MSFKKSLKELKKKKDKFTIPGYAIATCQECDWKGKVEDCNTEMDSEGWEYPEYEVLVCPKCGEYSIEI